MFSVRVWLIGVLGGCQLVFPFHSDEAPVDAPPLVGVDRDEDGVDDGIDNCVSVFNKDQHDEDLDTLGDVCDNCPHVANVDQANGDSDPIGDLCDDSPEHECMVAFVPFTSDSGTEQHGPGEWAFDGETARQTNPDAINTLLVVDQSARTDPLIVVGARVNVIGSQVDFHVAGVWHVVGTQFDIGSPGLPLAGVLSEIPDRTFGSLAGPAGYHLVRRTDGMVVEDQLVSIPERVMMMEGDRLTVSLDLRGPAQVIGTGVLDGSTASLTMQAVVPAGRVGLRTYLLDASFDYVFVVERRPPPCP
jgi:hypothetical protein